MYCNTTICNTTMRIVISDGGKGQMQENNDCVVRALAICYKIPYPQAHAIVKEAGRKDFRGFYVSVLFDHLMKKGFRFFKYKMKKNPTIRRFLEDNPVGIFYCNIRGHAFAVIHGEIHDSACITRDRQIIQSAYMISS